MEPLTAASSTSSPLEHPESATHSPASNRRSPLNPRVTVSPVSATKPCDAWRPKNPLHASQNLAPPPQTTDTEALSTRQKNTQTHEVLPSLASAFQTPDLGDACSPKTSRHEPSDFEPQPQPTETEALRAPQYTRNPGITRVGRQTRVSSSKARPARPDFRPAVYFWYDASMGQNTGRGAVISTFASLASLAGALTCCLPLGTLLLSAGSAGASLFSEKLRPWLLVLSAAALVFAFVQTYFRGRCEFRHRRLRTCLLWFSATVLLGMVVMPRYVASLMAGRLPSFSAASDLRDFDERQFTGDFDAALGQTRVVLLLSPT